MKISEALAYGQEKLKEAEIPTASLDARILLCEALSFSREKLISSYNDSISEDKQNYYNFLIERRLVREPVSKIVGVKEFWGMDFEVTQDVLDPRPDSEIIIEAVLKSFPQKDYPYRVCDLGVGSGCLIISLLKEYPKSLGVGVDISNEALAVAKKNAEKNKIDNRLSLFFSNWCASIYDRFDVVVSNPPYIAEKDKFFLEREVYGFDPHQALFGGEDGLDCYRAIAGSLKNILKSDGCAFIEIGYNQRDDVVQIMESNALTLKGEYNDLAGITRCLVFSNK